MTEHAWMLEHPTDWSNVEVFVNLHEISWGGFIKTKRPELFVQIQWYFADEIWWSFFNHTFIPPSTVTEVILLCCDPTTYRWMQNFWLACSLSSAKAYNKQSHFHIFWAIFPPVYRLCNQSRHNKFCQTFVWDVDQIAHHNSDISHLYAV